MVLIIILSTLCVILLCYCSKLTIENKRKIKENEYLYGQLNLHITECKRLFKIKKQTTIKLDKIQHILKGE